MKWVTLFFTLLITVSCKKDNNTANTILPEDKGCIKRLRFPHISHSVSTGNASTADSLFMSNGISFKNYRYYNFLHDSVATYFPPFAKFDSKIIGVAQYVNGIKVFTSNISYFFKNNTFNSKAGDVVNYIEMDTSSVLNTAQVRKLFIDDAERFEQKGKEFADSCLKTELGYYDINLHQGAPKYRKVWFVTLLNQKYPSEYPQAYYMDGSGQRIYYDDGIIRSY